MMPIAPLVPFSLSDRRYGDSEKKEMDVFFIKDVHFFFRLGIETYFADSPS